MKQEVKENKEKRKAILKGPFWATLLAAAITVFAFFMPLASANEEYKEKLQAFAQELNIEEIEMTNEDAIHISMFEYARVYWEVYSSIDHTLAVVVTAIIGAAGILSVLTLLFTLWKKPIAIFLFNLLTFGAYYAMVWDFRDRGVLPNRYYDRGIGYYLYLVGLVLVFVGAIWMFVQKRKAKRQLRQEAAVAGTIEE